MQRRGKEKCSTCVVMYRPVKVKNYWSNQQLSDHLSSGRRQWLWGPVWNTHWADSLPVLSQWRVSLTIHRCPTTPRARGSQAWGSATNQTPLVSFTKGKNTGCCSLLPQGSLAQMRMISKAASSPGASPNMHTQGVNASPWLNRMDPKDTSGLCTCPYYNWLSFLST